MKKNLITIKEFIDKSIGEWKSIRSTHTLAFQEFENTNSSLIISYQNIGSNEVLEIKNRFNSSMKISFAIKITWKSFSEWPTENKSHESNTILIFAPKDEFTGILIKDKGYAEQIPTSYNRPGEQISTTPSGTKITSAKNLMIDSMVRMIQKATNHSVEEKLEEEFNNN